MRNDRANNWGALGLGPPLALLASAGSVGWSCVPEGPRTDAEERRDPTTTQTATARDLDPKLTETFRDDFERAGIGSAWRALSNRWRVTEGQLCGRGAQNRGVWLRRRLPTNVRIAFDARSDSEEGDLKMEVFGDGWTGATKNTYDDATSYLLIYGGWHNTRHVLARLDEHGDDRLTADLTSNALNDTSKTSARNAKVKPHRGYRFRVERTDGKTISWWVDGELLFSYEDDEPLTGLGHDHFAFNNWNAPVCFDNVEIEPLW